MATVPDAPPAPIVEQPTTSSLRIRWSVPANNGGASLDAFQIGINPDGGGPPVEARTSDRDDVWSGLQTKKEYWFRARVHNAVGWSGWGQPTSGWTIGLPGTPPAPIVSGVAQNIFSVEMVDPADTGHTIILERQVGWSTSVLGNPTFVASYPNQRYTFSGLQPNDYYYARARVRNTVGWSSWSQYTLARTRSGAYVKVSGVWQPATVWIRVGGTWQIVKPWGRLLGYWEETD